jgi:membrane protease YdiL (CAAX protease family)
MTRDDAVVRFGVFFIIAAGLWLLTPALLYGSDRIGVSALASLLAGIAGNVVCARIFENRRLADFGLGWERTSARDMAVGVALGAGSVALLAAGAVAAGLAAFEPVSGGHPWPLPLLALLLLGGALGEELLFRGYPFQYLVREWNPSVTIAGSGAVFGLAHLATNSHINPLGALNTALWGALFGYAYWRTRALWLPIGLHFGWNVGLVLIGVPLSGTTIRVTGFGLHWSANAFFSGGDYGPEGGVFTTVLAGIVFVVLKRGRYTP